MVNGLNGRTVLPTVEMESKQDKSKNCFLAHSRKDMLINVRLIVIMFMI